MTHYIAGRLLAIALNMALVSVFVFLALRLIPGDGSNAILGESASRDQIAAFRKEHGLDKGLVQQYASWVSKAAVGNMGRSLRSNFAVTHEFKQRLPITLEIVTFSFLFSSLFGVCGGAIAAVKQDTVFDHGARFFAILGISMPSFLLLTIMLIMPARLWHYAPPFGAIHFFQGPLDNLRLFLPPTLLLAVGGSATLMRLTRTALLDVLRQDYMRTARSKGLAEWLVILKHGLPNALPPVLTFMGLQLGFLLAGSIVVEQVMGLPGLGTWLLTAVQNNDYPIVMAFSLYAAGVLMLISLLVDLMYAYLDPRIRYT